jgi:hypothetical protein
MLITWVMTASISLNRTARLGESTGQYTEGEAPELEGRYEPLWVILERKRLLHVGLNSVTGVMQNMERNTSV